MSVYRKNSDLINLGAYVAGSNASVDAAIRLREAIDLFLRQRVDSGFQPADGWNLLRDALAGRKP